jgi:subtilisin family serine protease
MLLKPFYKTTSIIILCLFVFCFSASAGLAQGPGFQPPALATPPIVPGEIVVKFQSNISLAGARNSLRAEGMQLLQASTNNQPLRVQVTPGQEATAIADLLARGDVEYATFNYQIHTQGDPNDAGYNLQWALRNSGQTLGTPGADISASEAWDLYTGGSDVIIAVIDTGVDLDHPDLAAKITSGSQAGYNFISPGANPNDDNGHGTHVAGIAAAASNNGKGVAGVSWGAKIMPLKILDSGGGGTTYNLSQAIMYAADHGAKVINMSLGGNCGPGWPDVEAAIDYAVDKGGLLIAASGNDYSASVFCPGAINGVMAVGATDDDDFRASYSNYGSALDVVAPGSSIYSTLIDSNPAGAGTYGYNSGTSMASPHAAGLAALLWSYAPDLSRGQIESIIQGTADDLGSSGWDQYYGYGRINARRALEIVTLQTAPAQTIMFLDNDPATVSSIIQVATPSIASITWSAVISPAVPWLSLSSPATGAISAATGGQLDLVAVPPSAYGQYSTTVVVTGTTTTGVEIGPRLTQVTLHYVPKVQTYFLPIIPKN